LNAIGRRQRFGAWLAIATLVGLSTVAATTQDYPARPIHLLVHTPAGSLVDTVGRMIAQELGEQLGQSLIIDNRPGAASMIAVEQVVRAPADGYTLLVNAPEATMLPFLKKSYHYDPIKDFTPIALVVTSWTVFAVNPKVPASTLAELITYSKNQPSGVRYGSGGVGSALHVAGEMLRLATGGNFVHVPYRGGAQAATDAVSGQIEMVSMGLASTRVAEGGKLRILAQAGPRRHPMLPGVPTTAEQGLPHVRMETWFGLVGPPKTPHEIVARINRELDVIVKQNAFQNKVTNLGFAVDYRPDEKFKTYMADESRKWQQLLPALGIPVAD
jgi:tripartite-type tricarboxylate transporter receptor subunit TctC